MKIRLLITLAAGLLHPCARAQQNDAFRKQFIEYKVKAEQGDADTQIKVRVRVEHVFATMRMCMRRAWNRCIGLKRNRAAITLTNLVYNMVRLEQIERLGLKNSRAA